MAPRLVGPLVSPTLEPHLDATVRDTVRKSDLGPLRAFPSSASWMKKIAVFVLCVVLALSGAPRSAAAEAASCSRWTPSLAAKDTDRSTQRLKTADSRAQAPIATASQRRPAPASGHSGEGSRSRRRSRETAWAREDRTRRSGIDSRSAAPRRASGRRDGGGGGADYSESSDNGDDSYENYDTEEGYGSAGRSSYDENDENGDNGAGGDYVRMTTGGWSSSSPGDNSENSNSGSEEEEIENSKDLSREESSRAGGFPSNRYGRGQLTDPSPQRQLAPEDNAKANPNANETEKDNAVEICIVTWNLAEATPSKKDMEFLKRVAAGSGLVAVGVQEIENLKPRRSEGGRTREWRRLLIQTLGRDFVRVGHHAMGAVQLTLFSRREILDRVKVVKLTEVVCGVGNVLQNKGGIGAFVRVDRTTFLFVAAHLAAHQGKLEERNAGYWRIVTALDQEIPPAWITHAARKRAKRAKAKAVASAAAATAREAASGAAENAPPPHAPFSRVALPLPRGPFKDHVDRVFFFGDLNYRVDLSREDMELGVSVCRRKEGTGEKRQRTRMGRRFRPGMTYPGAGGLDALLDFDQLTLARSQGKAFGGFAEARVTFEPTYKYDKGSAQLDTSRKMRPPAWTDRILFSPPGPLGVSSLAYESVPGSCHSDHRPVYATFKVQLAE